MVLHLAFQINYVIAPNFMTIAVLLWLTGMRIYDLDYFLLKAQNKNKKP